MYTYICAYIHWASSINTATKMVIVAIAVVVVAEVVVVVESTLSYSYYS